MSSITFDTLHTNTDQSNHIEHQATTSTTDVAPHGALEQNANAPPPVRAASDSRKKRARLAIACPRTCLPEQ